MSTPTLRTALESLLARLDQTTDSTGPVPAWMDSYCAAVLLQRLTSPAYLITPSVVVDRPPEGLLDLLKSKPGQIIEACSAGVSIEPLGGAPGPTFLDAIRLARGCHDYSGGHSGAEGEAWHSAIDTVVGVLKRAAVGPWDSQLTAVYGVGAEAGAGELAVPVPVSERRPEAKDCLFNEGATIEKCWWDELDP